jgi:hypothetical protein
MWRFQRFRVARSVMNDCLHETDQRRRFADGYRGEAVARPLMQPRHETGVTALAAISTLPNN